MTRARNELHLLEPQRFYVTQQAQDGDRHVYGARSRFLDEPVLAALDQAAWTDQPEAAEFQERATAVCVDVGSKLRALW